MTSGGDVQLYALIGFIPGALGDYLNRVRQELVPGCPFHSHITVLPPRVLRGAPEELSADLAAQLEHTEALEIGIGKVAVFASTNVIYLEVVSGGAELTRIHEQLIHGNFNSAEQYPFHPHITLAQEYPVEQLPALLECAKARWKEWPHGRSFAVKHLSFVCGADLTHWQDISQYELSCSRDLKTV